MRVLIIEDEIKLAAAMKRALELQNYTVEMVFRGDEGLEMALEESWDVIILDVMLPGLSGIEVCRALREELNATPVLMLTAKGQVGDKVSGLDAGADDYMVKPFSFDELFARIRALTRRPSKTKSSVLNIGDLAIDTATFKVSRQDKQIQLSATEYKILEFLARNRNKVLSREQIISNVWNYDADILPTTVEVHIKHLRDKVDAPFEKSLIKTVRGFGYELVED